MGKLLFLSHLLALVLSIIGFSYLSTFITENSWIQFGIIFLGSVVVLLIVSFIAKMSKKEKEEPEVEEELEVNNERLNKIPKEERDAWAKKSIPLLKSMGYLNEEGKVGYFWKVLAIISISLIFISVVGFGVFLYLLEQGKLSDQIDLKCEGNDVVIPACPSLNCPSLPSIPACPTVNQNFKIVVNSS